VNLVEPIEQDVRLDEHELGGVGGEPEEHEDPVLSARVLDG
jgi:hypothetical protein